MINILGLGYIGRVLISSILRPLNVNFRVDILGIGRLLIVIKPSVLVLILAMITGQFSFNRIVDIPAAGSDISIVGSIIRDKRPLLFLQIDVIILVVLVLVLVLIVPRRLIFSIIEVGIHLHWLHVGNLALGSVVIAVGLRESARS